MFFSKRKKYQNKCQSIHELVTYVTQHISPEDVKDVRVVRKQMSVFVYGVCKALVEDSSLETDELYYQYLLKGGLKTHQARVVVERTSMEFINKQGYEKFFDLGYALASNSNEFNESDAEVLKNAFADMK